LLLLGSCFAENIGQKLRNGCFRTDVNPCGIQYNPLSVAGTLRLLAEEKQLGPERLLEQNGLWVSLRHHGSFSGSDRNTCLTGINSRLQAGARNLREADILLITFGTAWVYRYRKTGEIAANCHRFPAADFDRFRLTPEEIVAGYEKLITTLSALNPALKIVFTVSPIRHWKEGAHGNQLSKSVLLLAIDELAGRFEQISYFPSYEIVLDELRDYRFYDTDMLHLSGQAVEYIWERFRETYLDRTTDELLKRVEKIQKSLQHRPFRPDTPEYEQFKKHLLREMEEVRAVNQNIAFSSGL
jgi:hypothetical protein